MRYLILLALILAGPAAGGDIFRYEAPDGSLAFTDDLARVPAAARPSVKAIPIPEPTRWTHAETPRAPYRWSGPSPSFEQWDAERRWGLAAEGTRRAVEDAAVVETFADEVGVGRGAARLNTENQLRRAERLEDACRVAGCLPGYLRRP